MVELTLEQATAIANKLGTMPANQVYTEITWLLQAIDKYNLSSKAENQNN